LPEFQPDKLKTTIEQAIYSAHTHKNNNPILLILTVPGWKHTPYLARNLHTTNVKQLQHSHIHTPNNIKTTQNTIYTFTS
jgi:hypothetical protein